MRARRVAQVVRQRQQVQTAADRACGRGYSGSLQTAAAIVRVEGPLALYRGFGITQVRRPVGPRGMRWDLPQWDMSKRWDYASGRR